MRMSNAQMLESVALLATLDEKGMLGYAIAKNRRMLAEEVQEYSQKRDELLREYGTDIGGGKFQLQGESAARFRADLKPYAELTADVPVMQISPEIFVSGGLTSSMMDVLGWMVTEERGETDGK